MHRSDDATRFAATDLSTHSDCERRTHLELSVLAGAEQRPGMNDVERRMLAKRGHEHETRAVDYYRAQGRNVVTAGASAAATLEALRSGADVVYQGTLAHGQWVGRPDFLVRVERPSPAFGAYSYEVADAKLAREARANAVLQLCAYSDWLGQLQGVTPERFWLIGGADEIRPEALSTSHYMALFRRARRWFERFVAEPEAPEPYPEPVEHCEVCVWWKRCADQRRQDDHLSLVAGISRRQRERLEAAGVKRLEALSVLDPERDIDGIGRDALARIREQARLQATARRSGKPIYELLVDAEPGAGLERLPEPSPGDVFLDLEGDAFVQGGGLEYLFGLVELRADDDPFSFEPAAPVPEYRGFWAVDRGAEKLAFEAVIDRIRARRAEWPGMHVYHFGQREADALKRLACRHATREAEVDELLRAEALVDLHRVVRIGLRASVESYSLKQLEAFYGFERQLPARDAATAMLWFGWWLETRDADVDQAALRERIERYNQDDCLSTLELRAFLERCRDELGKQRPLRRPVPPDGKASENRERENAEVAAVAAALLASVPSDAPEASSVRLLSQLLDWHWREAKSAFWEYFRARDVPASERLEDRAVLAGLRYAGPAGKSKRSVLHRYDFPPQEHAVREGQGADDPDSGGSDPKEPKKLKGVKVAKLGSDHVLISLGEGREPPALSALVPGKPFDTKDHRQRLLDLGRAVAEHGLHGDGPLRAARDLLLALPPRADQAPNAELVRVGEDAGEAVSRLALALDRSVLAVQGPPGSGKTYCAAQMILSLVAAGKRVGVTANSHRVILGLLKRVQALAEPGHGPRLLHIGDEDDVGDESLPFELSKKYESIEPRLRGGQLDVVGGTSWAWCRPGFAEIVDVLVVDEAGQLSLANVLAASHAARSLVLVGDPAQLEQPQKGVHPDGADASALEHLLGSDVTLRPDRGVFLPRTRRLHPAVCRFTSEVFYEGKLESAAEAARRTLSGSGRFAAPGLRFVATPHRGNTNHAAEEVERIADLIAELTDGATLWTDPDADSPAPRPLATSDVLVVAPYNAQVAALRRRLPEVSVGTVDKFQGAQAPVVIYSLTSSSADDAPRGLEFLYSLNRLNVATSRAQALVILVGSPRLAQARCKTPRQMQLVNALCRYLELAEPDWSTAGEASTGRAATGEAATGGGSTGGAASGTSAGRGSTGGAATGTSA